MGKAAVLQMVKQKSAGMPGRPRLPRHLNAVVCEFQASLPHDYAPVTRRVYVAAAKRALALIAPVAPVEASPGTLFLALQRASWTETYPRPKRLERFLNFLAQSQPMVRVDLSPLKKKIMQGLGEGTRNLRMPTLRQRRDLAFLAAFCAAPNRSNPRNWERGCLRVQGQAIYLWEKQVDFAELSEPLRLWAAWRDRLAHETPRSAIRRPPRWAHSPLLFPGRNGAAMAGPRAHAVLKKAIASCLEQSKGPIPWPGGSAWFGPLAVTPGLVRTAFGTVECWPAVPSPVLTSGDGRVPIVPMRDQPGSPTFFPEPQTIPQEAAGR